MQLIISHKLDKELVLPISYHYVLQGIIYNGLKSDTKYSSIIHSTYEDVYKPFCFSEISGKYRIENKNIIFLDSIKWEIRSIDVYLIKTLYKSFKEHNISYNHQLFDNITLEIKENTIETESIRIKMITPIVVYETIEKHRKYYNPLEDKFAFSVLNNLSNKYEKYFNTEIDKNMVSFEAINISKTDKVVTKYKNVFIIGWKGIYQIKGPRKYLDFLYQCGIGSLNSQGFGVFEISE